MRTGDRAMFFRRAHVALVGVLGVAALWSTALTEIASILLILLFVAAQGFNVERFRPTGEYSGSSRLMKAALILLGIHVTAVLLSISLTGTPFALYAGRVWRPLLLVVMLLTPMTDDELVLVGTFFFASGACAAGTTLVMNIAHGTPARFEALTGLTTFADLLVLTAIVGIALMVGVKGKNHPGLWIGAAELLVVFALFWTAERAPVAVLAVAGGTLIVSLRPRALPAWALVLGGFFLLGPLALRDKFGWLVHLNPVDRYVVWEEGLRQLGHVPVFGHGPGSYARLLPPEAWGRFNNRPPSSWHNDLLQVSLDNGPIAAAAIAGMLAVALWCAVKAFSRRTTGPGHTTWSYPGMLVFILALLGTVGSVVTTALLGDVFWVLLGMTMQAGCREERVRVRQDR